MANGTVDTSAIVNALRTIAAELADIRNSLRTIASRMKS
jgi:hypothetical protein